MSKQFDVIVIGGGPGGYIAAIRAAQLGFNVACIDEWKNEKGGPAPGGTCTNVGCIPSKALLQSSEHFEHANKHFAEHGITATGVKMDVAKMIARKDTVVKQNNDGILFLFKKNKVSFFHGRGAFSKAVEGGYEVQITGAANEVVTGKQIVIATGSNARALPGTLAPVDDTGTAACVAALLLCGAPQPLGLNALQGVAFIAITRQHGAQLQSRHGGEGRGHVHRARLAALALPPHFDVALAHLVHARIVHGQGAPRVGGPGQAQGSGGRQQVEGGCRGGAATIGHGGRWQWLEEGALVMSRAGWCPPQGACRTWKSSAANRPQRSIFYRLFAP